MNEKTTPVIEATEIAERIRALAHQMWEDEGRPEGRAEQHWLAAEAIVKTQIEGEQAQSPAWLKPTATPPVAEAEPAETVVKDLGDIRQRLQGRSVA